MDAQGLMRGNYLLCKINGVVQIEMFYGLSDFQMLHEYEDVTIDLKNCKPIPLTEEWLLKVGFKKDAYHNYVFKHINPGMICSVSFRFAFGDIPEHENVYCDIWIGEGSQRLLIDIKYVHQLQNLYFALTGEELKFNS